MIFGEPPSDNVLTLEIGSFIRGVYYLQNTSKHPY